MVGLRRVVASRLTSPAWIDPERAFLDKFALQTTSASRHPLPARQLIGHAGEKLAYQSPMLRQRALVNSQPTQQPGSFSYMEMAACCATTTPMDAAKAQEWLQAVIQKIGEAMNQCKWVRQLTGL